MPDGSSPEIQQRPVKRRAFLAGLAATGAAFFAGSQKAEAQLFNPSDPLPGPKAPEVNMAAKQVEVPKEVKGPEVPKSLENSLQKKAKITDNFLLQPPGEAVSITVEFFNKSPNSGGTEIYERSGAKNIGSRTTIRAPYLEIAYSPDDPRPEAEIVLEAGQRLGALFLNSHQSDSLPEIFAHAFQVITDASPNKEHQPAGEMAKTQEVLRKMSPLFEFSNYSDGIKRKELLSGERKFDATLLTKIYAIWICESEQLAQKLKSASPMDAEVFLAGLNLILDNGREGVSLQTVGISEKTLDSVMESSGKKQIWQKAFEDKTQPSVGNTEIIIDSDSD